MSKSNNRRASISPSDVVSLQGQYLVKADGSRFIMKGIGFPVPVPDPSSKSSFDSTAWNEILHQLRDLDLGINTVRVYRMDPDTDYSAFFDEAARLGIYVIVPLTAAEGGGVLDRNKRAPKCYSRNLFRYGVKCLENYLQYPNAVAGLIANEVMNSLETWPAAPCIKAYAQDLKVYMRESFDRPLPLIYAAQNSGVGPSLDAVSTMQLTMDYLTCVPDAELSPSAAKTPKTTGSTGATDGRRHSDASIDIFGINIESWCSSLGTFEQNEDGSEGSYYSLWKGLRNSSVPLVFSEMGCSHLHFDKDNGLQNEGGARDWEQVPIVLNQMSDSFSGFCAYAYYGNPEFSMFEGGPWRKAPLVPTEDFFNFRDQLKVEDSSKSTELSVAMSHFNELPICSNVETELKSHLNLELFDVDKIKSYATERTKLIWSLVALTAAVVTALLLTGMRRQWRKAKQPSEEKLLETSEVNYQTISTS